MASEEEETLLPYAVRARQQEARRAQVLAKRQAEREERRAQRQQRVALNSARDSYDPSAVARRRQEAIEHARRRKVAEANIGQYGPARQHREERRREDVSRSSSDESPPPPPTPPLSPLPTRDTTRRFFENARNDVVIFRSGRCVTKPSTEVPEVDEEAERKIKDADEIFRAMLRGVDGVQPSDRPSWNDDTEPVRRPPPPRRRRIDATKHPGEKKCVNARCRLPAEEKHLEEPLAPPEANEARRREALAAEEERRRKEPQRLPRRKHALRQHNTHGIATKRPPLCVRREREQRRRAAEAADEPETRRCLDKRTARLRYARHFAAAVAAYRARALSPPSSRPPLEQVNEAARVVVRVRPLLAHEEARGEFVAVSPDIAPHWVTVHECTMHADMMRLLHAARQFPCSAALGAGVDEDAVFECAARPGVDAAFLHGKPAALFMFGQTGSGKTYSMSNIEQRLATTLFDGETGRADNVVGVRYFEIRGKKAFDLLSNHGPDCEPPEIRLVDEASSCRTEGATVCRPRCSSELLEALDLGRALRSTAATDVNGGSSRSHAVCRLDLRNGGSLTLVDCAGSERSHDSLYHDAQRRRESAEINQSIYALKECIRAHNNIKRWRAAPSGAAHKKPAPPPFRSSALTRVLREALESDAAHLCVLATVSPAATDAEHSISTLRTVCELAGASPKLMERCASSPTEVPRLPVEIFNNCAPASADKKSAFCLPKNWPASRLAAFVQKFDARAAQRILATKIDGNNVVRMSHLAVAAALTDADSTRATKIIYALRDETARVDRIRYQARTRRKEAARNKR